jgi:hypothetical protein
MATLTVGLAGSGIANGSKGYTLSDTVVTKLVTWKRANKPVTIPPDIRTDAQVLVLVFDDFIQSLRDALTKVDQDAALAAVSVTPVVIT